jgi:hypothetical protein
VSWKNPFEEVQDALQGNRYAEDDARVPVERDLSTAAEALFPRQHFPGRGAV